jgi:nuclear GTP-binding protein
MVARKQGKLGKGGEPDINTIAKKVIFEWQRGQIPYCYLPEGMHESDIEKDEEEEEVEEEGKDIIEEEDSEPEGEAEVDMKD